MSKKPLLSKSWITCSDGTRTIISLKDYIAHRIGFLTLEELDKKYRRQIVKAVVGFLFDEEFTKVALIKKNRGPGLMAGHLNGIGGKFEDSDFDDPTIAICREFMEEAGLYVEPSKWNLFSVREFEQGPVYFLYASGALHQVNTLTDEEVGVYNVTDVVTGQVDDLYYNIPQLVAKVINSRESSEYPEIECLGARLDLMSSSEKKYRIDVIKAAKKLLESNKGACETLKGIYMHGPCHDGDVLSKWNRDLLIELKAVTKVVVNATDGYNGCTHFGRDLYRVIEEIQQKDTHEPNTVHI